MQSIYSIVWATAIVLAANLPACAGEDWPQCKYDSGHLGNVPTRSVTTPLGLVAAAPLTDGVFTSPVVSDGRVFVVDGSGVVHAFDAVTLAPLWRFATAGGKENCNNVASPAVADRFLHVGTMTGEYYVLDTTTGRPVSTIDCGDPVFAAPVVGNGRVYVATLGSRVYSLEPDGTVRWIWDHVRSTIGFDGDRWNPADWIAARKQTGWPGNRRDHFFCTRSPVLTGKMLVVPAGGALVWLKDMGDKPELRGIHYSTRESPVTLGLTAAQDGTVYRQWHRRDNMGSVEILRLVDGEVEVEIVPGTVSSYNRSEALSFCSVSLRGADVYRCRPEEGYGFCKHSTEEETSYLGGPPSIAAPILLKESAVYGGLDGTLNVVPLSGSGKVWSYQTPFGKAITAPVAVCDGRIYFGCDDGYLYVLGPDGSASPPTEDLGLARIRSPLSSNLPGPEFDWFTSFGNLANTNSNSQGLKTPACASWTARSTIRATSVARDRRASQPPSNRRRDA